MGRDWSPSVLLPERTRILQKVLSQGERGRTEAQERERLTAPTGHGGKTIFLVILGDSSLIVGRKKKKRGGKREAVKEDRKGERGAINLSSPPVSSLKDQLPGTKGSFPGAHRWPPGGRAVVRRRSPKKKGAEICNIMRWTLRGYKKREHNVRSSAGRKCFREGFTQSFLPRLEEQRRPMSLHAAKTTNSITEAEA